MRVSPAFTHLHVASGYSLRYGASTPAALVEAACEQGMSALALTDRDGLYGAVKFASACQAAGIDPILGADLAVEPAELADPAAAALAARQRPRTPVRGGAIRDQRHPRVTVLALGGDDSAGRAPGEGWGQLCQLVSATHLRGERGNPVSTAALVAQHAVLASGASALVVLLGPDSDVGRAALARRPDLARACLNRWRSLLPMGGLAVEVVCHHGPEGAPGSLGQAVRMMTVARQAGVPVVLTNAVRHATPAGGMTVDVLDAVRRGVPLDERHVDRVTERGHLASSEHMAQIARRISSAVGDSSSAADLLAATQSLARRTRLDPFADLGMGMTHLPEPSALGLSPLQLPQNVLRERTHAGIGRRYPGAGPQLLQAVEDRLEAELATIETLDYATYFLTVADVCDLTRDLGIRVAARGSGAGSLVNHLLGISGVDPIRYDLLMERFLTPLRAELPDIDIDVESARRLEVYEAILNRFGAQRVTCVSMMDSYRVRHAVRDAGAALGLPPGEVGAIAKALPHIRARDVRQAIADLPELRNRGLDSAHLNLLFDLVERLDGLPRHIALHPCGVVLSDAGLLNRTPVEASWRGFPMSQFDKDDVEELGLLKLDVLGIRMQSAMSVAVKEIARVDQVQVNLDEVPFDDEATLELIRSARTLGCFQIESPGQRELVGKFAPETFDDLIIDISLFRPGPVKSDMINPFLMARQGWVEPQYLHPDLEPILRSTCGVVVFHEQVIRIVAVTTGCTLDHADEVRRQMGSPEGQEEIGRWWQERATARGYSPSVRAQIWAVLQAFASFGFCKAHAAAFAVPTFHSAWLKAHHPAAFYAGVLTHDPGMYPKRLILDDARNHGVEILPLDINLCAQEYRVDRVEGQYGLRVSLAEVKGISDAEVARIVAGQPYQDLADFWARAQVSRPVTERLVLAGAFDQVHGIVMRQGLRPRGAPTRRDVLLQVAELDRMSSSLPRARRRPGAPASPAGVAGVAGLAGSASVRAAAAAQAQSPAQVLAQADHAVQLSLDFAAEAPRSYGLPDMTAAEQTHAELDILGLDLSRHVLDFYQPLLQALGVTRSADLLSRRNRRELLVAGVKVATQTPPVRSGRRVVFLTLDDSSGPVDATFFEDAQGPYAATVFGSWLMLVRGELRRTGPAGVSLRATGAWDLAQLWQLWDESGIDAVYEAMQATPAADWNRQRASGPVSSFDAAFASEPADHEAASGLPAGDRTRPRRVLVHPVTGVRQSPYADLRTDAPQPPRKLWHASPGSSGQ